jgi:RNA polymerase sigma-32 factor
MPGNLYLLTADEEATLARAYQRTRDPAVADRLVRAHLRLVAMIAREYQWSQQELADLVQVGLMGFLRALSKYDPSRGVRLSTYASHWIRAKILRFVMANWRLVRVSASHTHRASFIAGDGSQDDDGRAAALRRHLLTSELTLDAPQNGAAGEPLTTRVAQLPADDGSRPDVCVEGSESRAQVRATIDAFAATLRGREREIFDTRWRADEAPTLAALGDRFGISRERVRQIEARLLSRLRSYLDHRLDGRAALAAFA